MRLIISTEANALYTPGESICEECTSTDTVFLDAENDEYCAVLCLHHALFTIQAAIIDGRTDA